MPSTRPFGLSIEPRAVVPLAVAPAIIDAQGANIEGMARWSAAGRRSTSSDEGWVTRLAARIRFAYTPRVTRPTLLKWGLLGAMDIPLFFRDRMFIALGPDFMETDVFEYTPKKASRFLIESLQDELQDMPPLAERIQRLERKLAQSLPRQVSDFVVDDVIGFLERELAIRWIDDRVVLNRNQRVALHEIVHGVADEMNDALDELAPNPWLGAAIVLRRHLVSRNIDIPTDILIRAFVDHPTNTEQIIRMLESWCVRFEDHQLSKYDAAAHFERGNRIEHARFGIGSVVGIGMGYIDVDFETRRVRLRSGNR